MQSPIQKTSTTSQTIPSMDKAPMNYHYEIFICHAGETKINATFPLVTLFSHFCGKEFAFFDQTNLSEGQHAQPEILQAVRTSRILLVIVSKSFFKSNYTLEELETFLNEMKSSEASNKTIVPIFYEIHADACANLPKQYIHLQKNPSDSALQRDFTEEQTRELGQRLAGITRLSEGNLYLQNSTVSSANQRSFTEEQARKLGQRLTDFTGKEVSFQYQQDAQGHFWVEVAFSILKSPFLFPQGSPLLKQFQTLSSMALRNRLWNIYQIARFFHTHVNKPTPEVFSTFLAELERGKRTQFSALHPDVRHKLDSSAFIQSQATVSPVQNSLSALDDNEKREQILTNYLQRLQNTIEADEPKLFLDAWEELIKASDELCSAEEIRRIGDYVDPLNFAFLDLNYSCEQIMPLYKPWLDHPYQADKKQWITSLMILAQRYHTAKHYEVSKRLYEELSNLYKNAGMPLPELQFLSARIENFEEQAEQKIRDAFPRTTAKTIRKFFQYFNSSPQALQIALNDVKKTGLTIEAYCIKHNQRNAIEKRLDTLNRIPQDQTKDFLSEWQSLANFIDRDPAKRKMLLTEDNLNKLMRYLPRFNRASVHTRAPHAVVMQCYHPFLCHPNNTCDMTERWAEQLARISRDYAQSGFCANAKLIAAEALAFYERQQIKPPLEVLQSLLTICLLTHNSGEAMLFAVYANTLALTPDQKAQCKQWMRMVEDNGIADLIIQNQLIERHASTVNVQTRDLQLLPLAQTLEKAGNRLWEEAYAQQGCRLEILPHNHSTPHNQTTHVLYHHLASNKPEKDWRLYRNGGNAWNLMDIQAINDLLDLLADQTSEKLFSDQAKQKAIADIITLHEGYIPELSAHCYAQAKICYESVMKLAAAFHSEALCALEAEADNYLQDMPRLFPEDNETCLQRLSYPLVPVWEAIKQSLKSLREPLSATIEKLDASPPWQTTSTTLKDSFKLLLALGESLLGASPLTYAVMGIGSLARDEACPYSDFEFIFVIQDSDSKQLKLATKRYLKALMQWIELQLCALGETQSVAVWPRSINTRLAIPMVAGFRLDEGGNVPCSPQDPDSYLLGTADELIAKHCRVVLNDSKLEDQIIINALQGAAYLSGDKDCAQHFRACLMTHLRQDNLNQKLATALLHDHLNNPDFNAIFDEKTAKLNVKKGFLRLPMLITEMLALYYGVDETSTEARLETLVKEERISSLMEDGLSCCIAFGLKIRNQAHRFYQQEEDTVYWGTETKTPDHYYLLTQKEGSPYVLQEAYCLYLLQQLVILPTKALVENVLLLNPKPDPEKKLLTSIEPYEIALAEHKEWIEALREQALRLRSYGRLKEAKCLSEWSLLLYDKEPSESEKQTIEFDPTKLNTHYAQFMHALVRLQVQFQSAQNSEQRIYYLEKIMRLPEPNGRSAWTLYKKRRWQALLAETNLDREAYRTEKDAIDFDSYALEELRLGKQLVSATFSQQLEKALAIVYQENALLNQPSVASSSTSLSEEATGLALQSRQAKEAFLTTVKEALAIKNDLHKVYSHAIEAAWQALCQQCAAHYSLKDWCLLFNELHECCRPALEYVSDKILMTRHATYEQRQWYAQVCQWYERWEKSVAMYLPLPVQLVWHVELAKAAVQQQRWWMVTEPVEGHASPTAKFSAPDVIGHINQAFSLWKGINAAVPNDTSPVNPIDSPSAMSIANHLETFLEDCLQLQTHQILQPLLADYQQPLLDALKPLQGGHTGKMTVSDFQTFVDRLCSILPILHWLDAKTAQRLYAEANQACMNRQTDILDSIRKLATLSSPTTDQQKTLTAWQNALTKLLTQWQNDGCLELAASWQQKLRELPETFNWQDVPSPLDAVLAKLEQGLAAQIQAGVEPTLPITWEKAHTDLLTCLNRYVAYDHLPAYTQTKRRYQIRLRSYQLGCEQLSVQHTGYTNLAAWCEQKQDELSAQQPILATMPLFEPPCSIRSLLQLSDQQTVAETLQNLTIQARDWLPLPPCYFELLALQQIHKNLNLPSGFDDYARTNRQTSSQHGRWDPDHKDVRVLLPADWILASCQDDKSWYLHILVSKESDIEQPYFTAYLALLNLYTHILPPFTFNALNIQINTSSSLASYYANLSLDVKEKDSTTKTISSTWEFHQTISPKIEQHSEATDSTSDPFSWETCVEKLLRQVSYAVAQAQAEEQAIRTCHQALPTQPLLEMETKSANTKAGAAVDPDFSFAIKQRTQAHQVIQALWQNQEHAWMPSVALLVNILLHKPQAVENFLHKKPEIIEEGLATQRVFQEPPKTNWEKEKTGNNKESQTTFTSLESNVQPAALPLSLRLYRRLPRVIKRLYIQQLLQHGQPESILSEIYRDSDPSGWCYEQDRLAEAWQKILLSLCEDTNFAIAKLIPDNISSAQTVTKGKAKANTTSPPHNITISFLMAGQIVSKPLRSDIVAQLLDEKGQWRKKDDHISGRHQVLRVVIPATENQPEQAVWFKLNPEQPGTEYLVQQIDQRLGCFATPAQQLVKIQVNNAAPLPVLISEEVAPPTLNLSQSQNLADVLKHHPEQLEKLSPLSFISTLLRVLVINPEDDKSNDYFLLPDPDKSGYFRLVRIDNERAFFSPDTAQAGWTSTKRELNVKTIIFCLSQMTRDWGALLTEDARLDSYCRHIQRLVPAECFQDIMQQASDLHDQWCLLFSAEEAARIAQAGLAQQEIIFPVMLILPDCEKALLERLYLIQQAWYNSGGFDGFDKLSHRDEITHQGFDRLTHHSGLALLDSVQPDLAAHYRPLFESQRTPQARFEAGPGKLYQRDEKGQPSTTVSGIVSLSRQLNLSSILELQNDPEQQQALLGKLMQQVWLRQRYSATQAFYGVGLWHQKQLLQIEENLLAYHKEQAKEPKRFSFRAMLGISSLPLPDITSIQFKILPMADRSYLFKRISERFRKSQGKDPQADLVIAKRMLRLLAEAPIERLDLSAFSAFLTDASLTTILQQAERYVLTLDISDATALTPTIISVISQHCPNLRHFKARQMPWQQEQVIVENLAHLTRLDLSQSLMTTLELRELPALKQLKLQQCTQLESLTDQRQRPVDFFSTPTIQNPQKFPQLQYMDITGCRHLTLLQLIIELNDRFILNGQDVKPETLVRWTQFLYTQHYGEDSILLDKTYEALTGGGVLEFPESTLNQNECSYLIWLLKWEVPIWRVKIGEKLPMIFPKSKWVNNPPKPDTPSLTFLLLPGDTYGGTTALRLRFIEDSYKDSVATSIDFGIRTIKIMDELVKIQLWDSGGHARFFTIADMYIPGAQVCMLCVAKNEQQKILPTLMHRLNIVNRVNFYCTKILVLTKCDLEADAPDLAKNFAAQHGLYYFECSAKNNVGVEELFHSAALLYLTKNGLSLFLTTLRRDFPAIAIERDGQLFSSLPKKIPVTDFLLTDTYGQKQEKLPHHKNNQPAARVGITARPEVKTGLLSSYDSLHDKNLSSLVPEVDEALGKSVETQNIELLDCRAAENAARNDDAQTSISSITAVLSDLITPLINIDLRDGQQRLNASKRLPKVLTQLGLMNESNEMADFKNLETLQTKLKQVCLCVHYQYRSSRLKQIAADTENISPAQAYIQSHPVLRQYHDALLQTLEFYVKAAMLGMSDAMGAFPALSRPPLSLAAANQSNLQRKDTQITQLFKSARDIENQITQLAKQMTLAIRKELLEGKLTSARLAARERCCIKGAMKDSVGRTQGYKRLSVIADGSCGYTAFGITRENAAQLLTRNLSLIQNRIRPAVEQILLESEQFRNYLRENGHISSSTSDDAILENRERYTQDLAVLAVYINYDVREGRIDAGWAHPLILQSIAQIQNIELRLWVVGEQEVLAPHRRTDYYDYHATALENPDERVDLLFINGNHFERLEFIGYTSEIPDTGIYPHNSSGNHLKHHTEALAQREMECLYGEESLTPAQQQAHLDAGYLLEQLPNLVTRKTEQKSDTLVTMLLKILLNDPNYHYNEAEILTNINPSKHTPTQATPSLFKPIAAEPQRFTAKQQNCLTTLKIQTQQPITAENWQAMFAELEANLLEEPKQEQADSKPEVEDSFSELLNKWFDRLSQQTSSPVLVTSPGKAGFFKPVMEQSSARERRVGELEMQSDILEVIKPF